MLKLLIFIKNNKRLRFIWNFIELVNGNLFKLFYGSKFDAAAGRLMQESDFSYKVKRLSITDLDELFSFLHNQDPKQFEFFKPHLFDRNTLSRILKNSSYIAFGLYDGKDLIGYFFLRCFVNKKSFTARIVDPKYQGQGIAKKMGRLLHHLAWGNNFRVFGTASKNNIKSLRSYQAINNYKIIKELSNDYIYFEYLKTEERATGK